MRASASGGDTTSYGQGVGPARRAKVNEGDAAPC